MKKTKKRKITIHSPGLGTAHHVENMSFTHCLTLNIPFQSARQATIASNSLNPDPILKANELDVKYTTNDAQLSVSFKGVSDRVIRVAISNVIDNLKTVIECMDEFDLSS